LCSCLAACAEESTVSFEQKYSDKDAIFLLNNLSLTLNEDGSYVTKVHKRLRILKEEAKSLGEIPLPYKNGKDVIEIISAFTVTPDGKKHPYSEIQDFKIYRDFPMYSDAMVKVITMPEVNIGSVIEFEIVIASSGMPIKGAWWDSVNLDFPRPCKEVNTTITLPRKFNVAYKEFGLSHKPEITETPETITYSWKLTDVTPIEKPEEYLPPPTPDSFTNIVEFSSIKSWEDISGWYYGLVEKNLKITKEIEETAKAVCQGKETLKDKTRAILEYIQDNFRYVSMSFGENSLEPHPTDDVFRNKYGDCKDLSLLTMAMLKSAGIHSYVALFNNEFAISDPQFDLPFPYLFDHVILLVEDKANGDFYIDPLLDGYDIGEFPPSHQGAYTFIINEQGGKFDKLPIFDEKRNSTRTARKIELNADGSALYDVEYTWELSSSIEMRDAMKAMDKEAETKFYQSLDASLISGGEMITRHIEGIDKKYGLVKGYAKYRKKGAFPLDGPMMVIDIEGYDRDVDFTQKERKKPLFFPSNSLAEDITTYKIPKGFIVSHLPNDIHLNAGFFEIKREYVRANDTIAVIETTRYKRAQYPKEEYGKFKDFFDALPSQTRQRIILKKTRSWKKKISDIIAIIKE